MTPARFEAEYGVSRETMERLQIFADLLAHWTPRINLIAPSTRDQIWQRHIADSAQLTTLIPEVPGWLDLGAGAGLPGLIVAAFRPLCPVRLIESDQRKCAFLTVAAQKMQVSVDITNARIETADPQPSPVISARALAPLARLLPLAARFATPDTVFLFPKGAHLATELAEAERSWRIRAERIPSRSDPTGCILKITELQRR